nr:cytochrome c3 family protein [Enhygromyxa salina]
MWATTLTRTTPRSSAAECSRWRAAPAHECAGCHAKIYAEWRSSLHALAFDDPIFRAEYEPAPSRFCSNCHADAEALFGHDAHDGVSCSSCHRPDDTAPRQVGVEGCGRCHQFHYAPDETIYDPADALQDTVHEWRRSDAARMGVTCVDCHMPLVGDGAGRHHNHRVAGAADEWLVAQALDVSTSAHRQGERIEVTMRVEAADVGHRVPTGDVFRRLRVAAWTDGGDPVERWLGREFAAVTASTGEGFRLRPVLDSRVPAPGDGEAVELRLSVPDAEGPLHWSVELHRMPVATASQRNFDPETVKVTAAYGSIELER